MQAVLLFCVVVPARDLCCRMPNLSARMVPILQHLCEQHLKAAAWSCVCTYVRQHICCCAQRGL